MSTDHHTVDVPFADVTGTKIDINTGSGSDSLTIDLSLGAIPTGKTVAFNGGTGTNTLIGPSAAETWDITGANAGSIPAAGVSFVNVEDLTGGTGQNVFHFTAAGSVAGKINGGTGSSNWLDYSALGASVAVNLNVGNRLAHRRRGWHQ